MKGPKRQNVVSYLFSGVLHVGLIGAGVWLSAPLWVEFASSDAVVQTTLFDQSAKAQSGQSAWPVDGLNDPRAGDDRRSTDRTNVDRPPSSADPGLADFTRRRIEHARRAAENQSPEEQQTKLKSLGRRLNQVASEESVVELSDTLSQWLGANERATVSGPPQASDTGQFDVDTAQVSDVRKVETDEGVTYIVVLVDAGGHSTEAPLDDIDGPQLYKTFQLIKQFPLMETIYRRTVMGLLDQLTREPSAPVVSPTEPAAEPQGDDQ